MNLQHPYLPLGLPWPQPQPDGLDSPYWEGLADGLLRVQRCGHCGVWQWGPEWICHRCMRFGMEWVEVQPSGRVFSWTRVWHPVHPVLKDRGPYLVVLVELPQAGGIRMIGNLLGDAAQEVTIGEAVRGVFEPSPVLESRYTLLQWVGGRGSPDIGPIAGKGADLFSHPT